MCGISGIIYLKNEKVQEKEIDKMNKSIKHRGPDGDGIFINNNIGLGHVLLKIQDVTDKSKQPFMYKNWVLTYNGEIYNFKELRKKLEKENYKFSTSSDTEVLIKMIDFYGIDKTLKMIEGCFAFAIYNKKTEQTIIVRDRFGIKPLYYYKDNKRLIFSSEIKAILQCDNIKRIFNMEKVLVSINTKLWLDRESTLFKDINSVLPGTYFIIDKGKITKKEYYKLKFKNKYKEPSKLLEDFGKEFEKSVKKKLISQVPLAAFLSGGLDSSIVCKKLGDFSKEKLSTYTICYDFDNDIDKNHANILAEKEKYNKHNILITEDMYNLDVIDKVTYGVEEILIDKVYIPMYFNYKAAKDDGYTVVISGQGSDETWLGYIFTWPIFKYIGKKYNYKSLINDYYRGNMIFKDKLNIDMDEKVDTVMTKYLDDNLVQDKCDEINSYGEKTIKTILHDLLSQEDKIAMMVSVESRVPFVDDHKLVEIAYNASSKLKTYDGREKYVVRRYSSGKIDDRIVDRAKYPFPEPPRIYNEVITNICKDNWNKIKKSKIINKLIKKEKLQSIENFSELEQWWLLVYWRFETVFNMEV